MKIGEKGLIIFTFIFVIGIFFSTFISLSLSLVLIISLTFGCFLLGFSIMGNLRDSLFLMLIIGLGGILGVILNLTSDEMGDFHLRKFVDQKVEIKGNIIEEPKVSKDKYCVVVAAKELLKGDKQEDISSFMGEKFLLTFPRKGSPEFHYGDEFRVRGIVELAKTRSNPGGFDYRQYLVRQGIGVTMNLWSPKGITKIGYHPSNWVTAQALKVKNWGNKLLQESLGNAYYPLVQGLIFGDTDEIPEEISENFAKLGIIHILSVSGYHMVLIMGIIVFLVSLLPLPRLVKFILVVAGLSFYATMVGWSPPVTRAYIMGIGGLLGYLYKGKYDGKINWANILSLTILIVLFYKPQYLFDLGFQFTFTATWGIIFLTPVITNLLNKLRVPKEIQQITAGTLGAQIATIPIIAYYFNYVSLLSLAANLLSVLLVEIIIILGLISLGLGLIFYKLAYIANFSTGWFCWLLLKISNLLVKVPFAVVYVKQPSYLWMIIFYLILILAIWGNDHGYHLKIIKYRVSRWIHDLSKNAYTVKAKVYSSSIAIIGIIILGVGFLYLFDDNELKVTYLDVGQGDSILITTPKGKNILIDTGGLQSKPDYDIGGKVVASALLKLGVNKLDLLIITHDHFDHYGGAKGLIGIIKIKKVLLAMGSGEEEYNQVLSRLQGQGIPFGIVHRNQRIDSEENIKLRILNPSAEPMKGTESDSNNNSLVLKLTYGATIFYFTGDIQREVINQWSIIDPDSQKEVGFTKVWKVPHHGSKFSMADNFYQSLKPSLAVISVGKNTFGHPHMEILEELGKNNCKILRTDQLGAITIESDGKTVKGSWIKKGAK